MASIRLNANGEVPEKNIHLAVMHWVNQHPSISRYVIHIPNESKRTPYYGKLLKNMGMRRGVSDLFIAIPSNGYCGAWIEIKTLSGKVSPYQDQFMKDMSSSNYFTAVTRGVDDTIKVISDYCSI